MRLVSTLLRRGMFITILTIAMAALSTPAHPAVHAATLHSAHECSTQVFSDTESATEEIYNSFKPCTTTTQDVIVTPNTTLTMPLTIQLCNAIHDSCTAFQTITSDETIIFKDAPSVYSVIGSREEPGHMHSSIKGLPAVGNITFNFTLFSFSPTGISISG